MDGFSSEDFSTTRINSVALGPLLEILTSSPIELDFTQKLWPSPGFEETP
jgi:hypothetical protein